MSIAPGQEELDNLDELVALARREDLGAGDVTSAMLPPGATVEGRFVAREPLVVCGAAMLGRIAAAYDEAIRTELFVADGEAVRAGAAIAEWSGPAQPILAAERVALNFLQHLSGIATATAQYVAAVAGTRAGIYDTRKTTPGWRVLEKYAVRAGGGCNHRMGLHDAVLVKDNHLAILARARGTGALPSLAGELARARQGLGPGGFVEIEVDTFDQFAEALKLPVDVILLDNMDVAQLARAVRMREEAGLGGKVALEASGGIALEGVRAVAQSGVERIAVGALTHSARAVDVSLDICPAVGRTAARIEPD